MTSRWEAFKLFLLSLASSCETSAAARIFANLAIFQTRGASPGMFENTPEEELPENFKAMGLYMAGLEPKPTNIYHADDLL